MNSQEVTEKFPCLMILIELVTNCHRLNCTEKSNGCFLTALSDFPFLGCPKCPNNLFRDSKISKWSFLGTQICQDRIFHAVYRMASQKVLIYLWFGRFSNVEKPSNHCKTLQSMRVTNSKMSRATLWLNNGLFYRSFGLAGKFYPFTFSGLWWLSSHTDNILIFLTPITMPCLTIVQAEREK